MKITKTQLRRIIRESLRESEDLAEEEGCWDGYAPGAQGGPKTKEGTGKNKGKRVNNCEPLSEDDKDHLDEAIALAVFEAKKKIDKERMKCDSPRYLRKGEPGYGDKQKVVKACDGDKQKLIKFGDANLENKSDNPDSRKNFRARHNCEEKDDEMTAGYWACKDW